MSDIYRNHRALASDTPQVTPLRLAIADHRFEGLGGVTASFGVAEMVPGEDSRSLAQRVDEALYRAKALGRNRVAS